MNDEVFQSMFKALCVDVSMIRAALTEEPDGQSSGKRSYHVNWIRVPHPFVFSSDGEICEVCGRGESYIQHEPPDLTGLPPDAVITNTRFRRKEQHGEEKRCETIEKNGGENGFDLAW